MQCQCYHDLWYEILYLTFTFCLQALKDCFCFDNKFKISNSLCGTTHPRWLQLARVTRYVFRTCIFLTTVRTNICFFYAFLKPFRIYWCFLNLCMLRIMVVVLVKIFDIYIRTNLYIFRFIIFNHNFDIF